ncbi:CoA transferase [Nocardia sp. NPDC052278]|uniref:CoA transferase n=1 Tax=unclassified Nocardia TaxID=2637762 RepID=UPI0036BD89BD
MTAPPAALPTGRAILDGLRVIEVSSFVATPLGGMTLAQLGADVIRIDPLGGAADIGRWPLAPSGTSMYWTGLNKGKRSVTVDFRSPAGRELITRLITESGPAGGILLTNAGNLTWLAHNELQRIRPDVIQVQIQGHHDGAAAVDYTVNAAIGFPLVTGPAEHDGPVNHVLPAWDIACGLYAAVGILAAERRRRTTGSGELVRVALYDVALAMAGNLGLLAEAGINGTRREPIGNHLYGGYGCDFRTRDGRHVMVVALTTRHWRDLLTVTGLHEAVTALEQILHADFTIEGDRYRHRAVLSALLGPWFEERKLPEVEQALGATSVLWSTYRSFADLVADSDGLRANPIMAEIEQTDVGTVFAPGSPLRFGYSEPVPVRPAPELGAHTDAVLTEILGLTPAELAGLHRDHVLEPHA